MDLATGANALTLRPLSGHCGHSAIFSAQRSVAIDPKADIGRPHPSSDWRPIRPYQRCSL